MANSASDKCEKTQIPVPLSFRNKYTVVCKTSKGSGLNKIRSRRASMPFFTITDSEEENNDADNDYVEKEEEDHVREKKLTIASAKSRKKIIPKTYQLKVQRKRKTEAAKEPPTEVTNTIHIQPETSHTNIKSSMNDRYFVNENDDGCGMSTLFCRHFFSHYYFIIIILSLSSSVPWQTRAILTKAVFEMYTDFKREPLASGSEEKYTARCKMCPQEFASKTFYKNNISNLSSHLKHVSFMYFSLLNFVKEQFTPYKDRVNNLISFVYFY